MKKTNDNNNVSKATRAKAAKSASTAGSDAISTSELGNPLQTPLPNALSDSASQERTLPRGALQNSAETEPSGQRSSGLSDGLEPSSQDFLNASSAFEPESLKPVSGQRPERFESDAVDGLLPSEASFSVGAGSMPPKINPRPSLSEDRNPSIVSANNIRRHAVNRAPNFQSTFLPVNQSSDRIAIFIDGSNLFYAASHLNIEVDYRRLLTTLVRGRRLLRAYFYTGVDPQNEKQRGFLLWLNRHGHRVVSKELVQLPDGSRKANMHVEMAVDMMRISEYCSTLTLLGGDGNLAYALEVLSQRGVSIEVVSLQSMTSDSLIDLADSYTDLADLKDEIRR
jgi:uncharacterized LabA/DUF88 family protein